MRHMTELLLRAGLVAAAALGGCSRTDGSPPAGPAASYSANTSASLPPDWPQLPEGAVCTGDLVRFQAILKSDVDKGYINRPVYDEVQPELREAAETCAAGRDAEARRRVQAAKKRYGYRS
jgi:hypothetical protein